MHSLTSCFPYLPWKVPEARPLSLGHTRSKAECGTEKGPTHETHRWQMKRHSSSGWQDLGVCWQTPRYCMWGTREAVKTGGGAACPLQADSDQWMPFLFPVQSLKGRPLQVQILPHSHAKAFRTRNTSGHLPSLGNGVQASISLERPVGPPQFQSGATGDRLEIRGYLLLFLSLLPFLRTPNLKDQLVGVLPFLNKNLKEWHPLLLTETQTLTISWTLSSSRKVVLAVSGNFTQIINDYEYNITFSRAVESIVYHLDLRIKFLCFIDIIFLFKSFYTIF